MKYRWYDWMAVGLGALVLSLILVDHARAQVVCDGNRNVTAGIQAMVDSTPDGGEVIMPDGPCMVSGFYVPRSMTLTGRGRTTIRRIPGTWEDLISIPAKYGQHQGKTVANVTIRGITVDGNLTPVNPPGTPNYSGIRVLAGSNLLIENSTIMNLANEGIAVGAGYEVIRNLIIRNSRLYRIQRNAIHLGSVDVAKILNCWIEETPDQLNFGDVMSGNAIDVEVEGVNAIASKVLIDGCYMARQQKVGRGTAGFGVAFQPAYGPIRGAVVRNCTIRNHNGAFQVNDPLGTMASGFVFSDNIISRDQDYTSGYGLGQFIGATDIQLLRNVLRFDAGPSAMAAAVQVLRVNGFLAAFNELFPYHWPYYGHPAEKPTFLIQDSSDVWLDRNRYNGSKFVQQTNSTVTETGNIQVP